MSPVCGEALERLEIRCARCAVSGSSPDSEAILTGGQSLAYRLARSVTMAAGGAFAGAALFAAALGVLVLIPFILDGLVLAVTQVIVMLAGIIAAVAGFSAVFVSFAELQRNAGFEVSKTVLRFNDEHAEFIEREIELAAVRRVGVDQGWFARLFRYGAIEIFTDFDPKPAAVIPGVSRPYDFKERFELILRHRKTKDTQGAT